MHDKHFLFRTFPNHRSNQISILINGVRQPIGHGRESNSYFTNTQLLLRCPLSFLKQIFFFLVNIWSNNSGKRIWFHQGENMPYYRLPLVIFAWQVLKGENVRKSPTNVLSILSTLRVLLRSVLKIKILFVLANR